MNKYFKAVASSMVAFSMLLSAVVTPTTVLALESQFGFDTNFDFNTDLGPKPDYFTNGTANTNTSGEVVVVSEESTLECGITASRQLITIGDSIDLTWNTTDADSIKINGKTVSGNSGSETISSIRENTTFVLEALGANGAKCVRQVEVVCLPPDVPKYCELNLHKTVDKSHAVIGEEVTYTIAIKNTGDADCTGGGVKIEDMIDANLVYKSVTVSSNLSAGYGNKPVYTNSDRTLRFNGHDLTPGEEGTITWTGTVSEPTQCGDFVVKNQAKATAKELSNFSQWVYSETVKTTIDNNCSIPVCEPGNQHYNPEADLTGSIYAEGKGRVVNSSAYCAYKVGLASYEKFDEIIDNQKLFDSATGIVGAKSTIELMVTVPACAYQIDLFYGDVLTSLDGQRYGTRKLDWAHLNSDKPYCGVPQEEFAKVIAEKIVCTDEAELPNYSSINGPDITANSAANWVATHSSCTLVAGWEFQWTDNQNSDPGDVLVGKAGAPWSTFSGATDSTGKTSVDINLTNLTNDRVWFREVLKAGFIPFTHGQNAGTNVDDVSAEMYCNTDVKNYDNYDFILGMEANKTYHCVAWNAPIPEVPAPTCDMFKATPSTIMLGGKALLEWNTSNATEVFLNNAIGKVDADGSIEVSPVITTTYKLTVNGADNKSVNCEVPVTVSEDKVPACEFFTATPSSLPVGGGDVTLAWKITNGLTASIAPAIGAVSQEGTRVVNVTQGTTYELTAEDDNGDKITCPSPVVVADPTPVFTCEQNVNFSISDSSIERGDSTTLTWSTTNVDSLTISNINKTTLSGSETVSPSSDTTYTLAATQGSKTINCPVAVNVSSGGGGGGGGGGGSSSPRCELDISDKKITLGEEITLRWDTSRATEITLTDDEGEVLFTTDDYLSKDKEEYFDGSITIKPTKDTQYTLLAERGSRDRECKVEVEVEDDVVVLQVRDQQPLVAGISLTQVPYTGFEAGPFMTYLFYLLLGVWSLFITYLLVMRNKAVPAMATSSATARVIDRKEENVAAMRKAESVRPDVFTPSVMAKVAESQATPANLPTGTQFAGQDVMKTNEVNANPHQVGDAVVTELENRAHEQNALLSSDSIRHFIASTEGSVERNEALDSVIAEAKKSYPLEDGWVVINEARMQSLCEVCQVNAEAQKEEAFVPSTVPAGSGSLAEAIVTGNVVAAYEMIGNRPMFAVADAAADLDSVYRNRKDGNETISDLLQTESDKLSDEQIQNMITALTGALDGTYTDEASAVKMAIMKAVKAAA